MSSQAVECDASRPVAYVAMTSPKDKRAQERGGAASGTDNCHRTTTDFRMIPSEADCQGLTTIVLLFNNDVSEVTVSMTTTKQHQQELTVNKIDSRAVSFIAPEQYDDDKVSIIVSVKGQQIGGQQSLRYNYTSLHLAAHLSTLYCRLLDVACRRRRLVAMATEKQQEQELQQRSAYGRTRAVNSDDVDSALDSALVSTFNDTSSPTTQRLFTVYQHRPGDGGGLSTPLHVAAVHGLTTFVERMSSLPDASVTATLTDLTGQTPSSLARHHGNIITADVIDRLTNHSAPSRHDHNSAAEDITANQQCVDLSSNGNYAETGRHSADRSRTINRTFAGPAPDGSSYFVLRGQLDDDVGDAVSSPAVANQLTTSVPNITGRDDTGPAAAGPGGCVQQRPVAAPRSQPPPTDQKPTDKLPMSPPGVPAPAPPLPTPCGASLANARHAQLTTPPTRPGSAPLPTRDRVADRDQKSHSSSDAPPPLVPRRPPHTLARTPANSASPVSRRNPLPPPGIHDDDAYLMSQTVPPPTASRKMACTHSQSRRPDK